MKIALPPELESYVERKVKKEKYNCASEVIHEALWRLEEQDWVRERRRELLRTEIMKGEEQIRKGNYTEIKSDEESRDLAERVIRRGRERMEARKNRKQ